MISCSPQGPSLYFDLVVHSVKVFCHHKFLYLLYLINRKLWSTSDCNVPTFSQVLMILCT